MSKYNIYKILPGKTSELLDKLTSANLCGQKQQTIGGYTMQLFFPVKPDEKEVPWVEQYRNFIDEKGDIKNITYFAVLLIFKNKEIIYAVSLGKSFFYLQDFCDLDFGINIGLRILDKKSVNSKNAKLFGSSKTKSLILYKPNTQIDIESGESVVYLKGKTVDKSQWGKNLTCGNSAYFSIKDFKPTSLPSLIDAIENALKSKALFNIPRATNITDQNLIRTLDQELIDSLKTRGETIEVEEQALFGIDFIFKKDQSLSIKFEKSNGWIPIEEQSILELMTIFKGNNFVLAPENIETVKIRAFQEAGPSYTRNIKYFINYVNEDYYFLNEGKWYKLNSDYVTYLHTELDRIEIEQATITFSKEKCRNHINAIKDKEEQKRWYRERYFNEIECTQHGFINLDRELEYFAKFSLEVADLFKDDTIYHVKIGNMSNQSYLLQQCMASLKYLKECKGKIKIAGKEEKPTTICLWCILERKNPIQSLKELRSFLFLSELLDCYKAVKDAELKLRVMIGYI